MFESFGLLKPLNIFVHSVFPCKFVTSWKMIDTLVRQQGLKQTWIRIGARPHYVEILVGAANFCKSIGKKYLAYYSRLSIHQLEGETMPGSCRVRARLPQNLAVEDNNRVALGLHGRSPLEIHGFIVSPGA